MSYLWDLLEQLRGGEILKSSREREHFLPGELNSLDTIIVIYYWFPINLCDNVRTILDPFLKYVFDKSFSNYFNKSNKKLKLLIAKTKMNILLTEVATRGVL